MKEDQLNMFRAIFCPSSGAWDWDFYSIWYLQRWMYRKLCSFVCDMS